MTDPLMTPKPEGPLRTKLLWWGAKLPLVGGYFWELWTHTERGKQHMNEFYSAMARPLATRVGYEELAQKILTTRPMTEEELKTDD